MKRDWKTILKGLAGGLAVLVFGGIVLFFVYLFANFGLTKPYLIRMVPVIGIALLVPLTIAATGFVGKKWMRRLWLVSFAVFAGCLMYIGQGIYYDVLPGVDDRTLILQDYIPFAEDTKAVKLEEESTLQFTDTKWLRLDGATALYPVYSAFVQAVYPDPQEAGTYSPYNSKVECGGTIRAYERLISGEVDMIFAAGPSAEQLKMAEKAGKELSLTPIGREAFVFFVNSKNPVESLTVEEIQGIYTGEIKNWKELGGKWQRIRPFQRAENSGSQTSLQKLMAGLPLMEPEEEDRIAGMGGIIRSVASYRNHSNAIGFSFRYYSTEMVKNGDIRLLALNGVEPTKETIRDGSYPIASEFYAVTAAPVGTEPFEERNSTAREFLDWILSEQGQWIIEETGYVSLHG